MGEGNLKSIFWNVAGTKKLRKEDWDYLRKFDIIGLVETWVENEMLFN